ncbi:MAG: PilZ domain-containing protein [Anaerolineales bacterium]
MTEPIYRDRRRLERRNLAYYMPVLDSNTQKVIGHLVDISQKGLMMDSKAPIPTNLIYDLHLDFMEAVDGKGSLDFTARSKWCRPDSIQPFLYNAGFEFVDIAPEDTEVVKSIAEKYGAS